MILASYVPLLSFNHYHCRRGWRMHRTGGHEVCVYIYRHMCIYTYRCMHICIHIHTYYIQRESSNHKCTHSVDLRPPGELRAPHGPAPSGVLYSSQPKFQCLGCYHPFCPKAKVWGGGRDPAVLPQGCRICIIRIYRNQELYICVYRYIHTYVHMCVSISVYFFHCHGQQLYDLVASLWQ